MSKPRDATVDNTDDARDQHTPPLSTPAPEGELGGRLETKEGLPQASLENGGGADVVAATGMRRSIAHAQLAARRGVIARLRYT